MRTYQKTLINLLAKVPDLRTGAEVGVHYGETSVYLLDWFPELHLTLVDNWAVSKDYPCPDQQKTWREKAIKTTRFAERRRTILEMDSVEAARQIADGSLDFAFLDACHTLEAVRADITAYWPKIQPGGVLCGHDFAKADYPGVTEAVREFAERENAAVISGPGNVWWAWKLNNASL